MNDISLRDYFAAHAPAEPWPEFQPAIEIAIPDKPPLHPVGNYGEAPNEDEIKKLKKLQNALANGDLSSFICYPDLLECYSYWLTQWNKYYTAIYRLRFAEFRAADHLPTELAEELTAAIDGAVAALRDKEVLP